jgi:hypothetical protein
MENHFLGRNLDFRIGLFFNAKPTYTASLSFALEEDGGGGGGV